MLEDMSCIIQDLHQVKKHNSVIDSKIANIYYADYESTHSTDLKADLRHAVYNETAETHLIWSAPESE